MSDSACKITGETIEKFAKRCGRSVRSVYRWIQRDWIKASNISGQLYILSDENDKFWTRVQAGEFHKDTESVTARTHRKYLSSSEAE